MSEFVLGAESVGYLGDVKVPVASLIPPVDNRFNLDAVDETANIFYHYVSLPTDSLTDSGFRYVLATTVGRSYFISPTVYDLYFSTPGVFTVLSTFNLDLVRGNLNTKYPVIINVHNAVVTPSKEMVISYYLDDVSLTPVFVASVSVNCFSLVLFGDKVLSWWQT